MLNLENGNLTIVTKKEPFHVFSKTDVPKGPWPKRLVLPMHCEIRIEARFVTKKGDAVDLRDFSSILRSLGTTRGQRAAVTRRIKELGLQIKWEVKKVKA